jgi:hypothetical protein
VSGNLVAGMIPGTGAVVDAANLLQVTQRLDLAWQVNFYIFTAVYVMATLLWLRFDSTKPVVPPKARP